MTVSDEAKAVVKDRAKKYGHPADVYARVAKMWEGILGTPIETYQVALCQIALKLGREAEMPNIVPDNLVDMGGYANVTEMIYERRPPSAPRSSTS